MELERQAERRGARKESQGHDMALTALCVPSSIKKGFDDDPWIECKKLMEKYCGKDNH